MIQDIFGALAAILTTLSFLPQVLHTLKTRDTRSLSLGMYSIFTAGVACWLVYGIMLGAWPIIAANVVTLLLAGTVLIMKLRHG
ncbi:MAG: hypothetical protein D6758_06890 [Gammaproteobacteria bacterium]|nr:MAG: hypothetical protein D6758_06890 [Gammaproteobacteria bacterium]